MTMGRVLALLLVLLWLPALGQPVPLTADGAPLEDFGPTGVAWLPDGSLFVCDRRYNTFHIFDTRGRRLKYLGHPRGDIGHAWYNALARFDAKTFFAAGSHYHIENNVRYVNNRSVIHKLQPVWPTSPDREWGPDSGELNFSPDQALRATGYYGESPQVTIEVSGLAFDTRTGRYFLGCSQPRARDGTVLLWVGKTAELLRRPPRQTLAPVRTGLKPAVGVFLADLDYVPGKGLALLLTSATGEGDSLRFGSSQVWLLPGGHNGRARLLAKDVAPGNRATGMAWRAVGQGNYRVALVCDNDLETTKIPSRLVLLTLRP